MISDKPVCGDIAKPTPPLSRLMEDGFCGDRCPWCGSDTHQRFGIFGKVDGCVRPECINYWKTLRFIRGEPRWKCRLLEPFRNFKFFIWNRFINRTHLIDTKLERGRWWDADHRILHGMMAVLVDFVENEEGLENLKKGADISTYGVLPEEARPVAEIQVESSKALLEVYIWWKDLPEREKKIKSLYDEGRKEESFCLEEASEEEEKRMLHKLVDHMGSMWT